MAALRGMGGDGRGATGPTWFMGLRAGMEGALMRVKEVSTLAMVALALHTEERGMGQRHGLWHGGGAAGHSRRCRRSYGDYGMGAWEEQRSRVDHGSHVGKGRCIGHGRG